MPAVLDSVLQPHVEVYKKNLKPQADGKDVVNIVPQRLRDEVSKLYDHVSADEISEYIQ